VLSYSHALVVLMGWKSYSRLFAVSALASEVYFTCPIVQQ